MGEDGAQGSLRLKDGVFVVTEPTRTFSQQKMVVVWVRDNGWSTNPPVTYPPQKSKALLRAY